VVFKYPLPGVLAGRRWGFKGKVGSRFRVMRRGENVGSLESHSITRRRIVWRHRSVRGRIANTLCGETETKDRSGSAEEERVLGSVRQLMYGITLPGQDDSKVSSFDVFRFLRVSSRCFLLLILLVAPHRGRKAKTSLQPLCGGERSKGGGRRPPKASR